MPKPPWSIATLYVDPVGRYGNIAVEVYDGTRDARTYEGPYPVVAHPPCREWGRLVSGLAQTPQRRRGHPLRLEPQGNPVGEPCHLRSTAGAGTTTGLPPGRRGLWHAPEHASQGQRWGQPPRQERLRHTGARARSGPGRPYPQPEVPSVPPSIASTTPTGVAPTTEAQRHAALEAAAGSRAPSNGAKVRRGHCPRGVVRKRASRGVVSVGGRKLFRSFSLSVFPPNRRLRLEWPAGRSVVPSSESDATG